MSHWRERAACLENDPELFFPDGVSGGPALRQVEAAKEVCAPCPVWSECLTYAMETREDFGVWGGLAQDERYELRRRRKNAERQRRREREKARA